MFLESLTGAHFSGRSLDLNDYDEIRFIAYPAMKRGVITCSCGKILRLRIWFYGLKSLPVRRLNVFSNAHACNGISQRGFALAVVVSLS
jgi:hypothetical protein